jgi:hypothetical protein
MEKNEFVFTKMKKFETNTSEKKKIFFGKKIATKSETNF